MVEKVVPLDVSESEQETPTRPPSVSAPPAEGVGGGEGGRLERETLRESLELFRGRRIRELRDFVVGSGFLKSLSPAPPLRPMPELESFDESFYSEAVLSGADRIFNISKGAHEALGGGVLQRLAGEFAANPQADITPGRAPGGGGEFELTSLDDFLRLSQGCDPKLYNEVANYAMQQIGVAGEYDYASLRDNRSRWVVRAAAANILTLEGLASVLAEPRALTEHLAPEELRGFGERVEERFKILPFNCLALQRGLEERFERAQRIVEETWRQREEAIKNALGGFALGGLETVVKKGAAGEGVLTSELFQDREQFLAFIRGLREREDYSVLKDDETLRAALPPELFGLRGLTQYDVHGSFDVLSHTLRVCERVETEGLSPYQAAVLRAAALLHDLGKRSNPLNTNHAFLSAQLAIPVLERAGYNPRRGIGADTIRLIKFHDAFGFFMKGQADADETVNVFTPGEDSPLGLREMVELGRRMVTADVSSMPGSEYYLERRGVQFAEDVLGRLEREAYPAALAEVEKRERALLLLGSHRFEPLPFEASVLAPEEWEALFRLVGRSEFVKGQEEEVFGALVDRWCASRSKEALPGWILTDPGRVVREFNQSLFEELDAGKILPRDAITNLHRFLGQHRRVAADRLLEHAERSLGEDGKFYYPKRLIFLVRRDLREGPEEEIPALSHGSSSLVFEGLREKGALLSRTSLYREKKVVLTGEGDYYVRAGSGLLEWVSLTVRPQAARAYAKMHEEGNGYALEPETARLRLQKEAKLQRRLFDEKVKRVRDFLPLPEEELLSMPTGELRGRVAELKVLEKETVVLLGDAGAFFAALPSVGALTRRARVFEYVAAMPPAEQRRLYLAYPLVVGVNPQIPLSEGSGSEWLGERHSRGDRVEPADLRAFYVPLANLSKARGETKRIPGVPRDVVTRSIEVLGMLQSIETLGESEEDFRYILGSLLRGSAARLEGHRWEG